MIYIEDIRRKARDVLHRTRYLPYADSPTIRAYTNWDVFEKAFNTQFNTGYVKGVIPTDRIPSFSFDVQENRALAHHFSRLPLFYMVSSKVVRSYAKQGHTAQHLLLCAGEDRHVRLEDYARAGSKSITLDILVRPGASLNFDHVVFSSHPHYVYVRVHLGAGSSFSGRVAVVGADTHVHYKTFLNGNSSTVSLSGVSLPGRADVVTDAVILGKQGRAEISHMLLSGEGSFLVHRGVLRIERSARRAYADMDSAFLTTGGFVASVPQLEVLTDDVTRAAHRSRDLSLGEEQLFYLRSRGLSPHDALLLYITALLRNRVGSLSDDKPVQEALRSFSRALQR